MPRAGPWSVVARLSAWAVASLVFAASFAVSAQSQYDGYTLTQSIKIYDAIVEFPPPSWYRGKGSLDFSEIHKQQSGPQFVLEHIPKGERFEDWSRMYTLRGTYIGPQQHVPLENYVSSGIAPYAQACGRENLFVQGVVRDGNSQTIVIYCQNSPHGPKGIGYGHGVGAISLVRFFAVKHTLLKVSQEWRGKAFLARDESSWPVPRADLQMMIERFAGIGVFEDPLR